MIFMLTAHAMTLNVRSGCTSFAKPERLLLRLEPTLRSWSWPTRVSKREIECVVLLSSDIFFGAFSLFVFQELRMRDRRRGVTHFLAKVPASASIAAIYLADERALNQFFFQRNTSARASRETGWP